MEKGLQSVRPSFRPSFRVMKFGGTSVAGAGRMRAVTELVAGAAEAERVVVVASAVSGVTDLLVQGLADAVAGRRKESEAAVLRFRELHSGIAGELGEAFDDPRRAALEAQLSALAAELAEILRGVALLGDCSPRVEARALVLGERASCALLFEVLASRGLDVEALDPRGVLPCSGDPRAATPQPAEMHRRLAARREAGRRVLLMPGFFGGDESGQVMCLGRGGSDYSAALLAQALEARLLEIWTDVDGVFTTDPRLAPGATCLESMSYEEAMELAHFGAKVLHPRTIAPARAAGVPVRIRNTFRPGHPGTLVERRNEPTERAERVACGISFTRGVALLSLFGPGMEGVPGVAARLFAALASRGISVILITQGSSETAISLCVEAGAAGEAEAALCKAFQSEIDTGRVDEIVTRCDLAIVSLVGDGMRERVGVAGRFFGALGRAGVNVAAIAQGASERSISAVIAAQDGARAVAAVHERLFESAWNAGSPTLSSPAAARKLAGPLPESGWLTAYAPAGIGNFAAGFDLLGAAIAPLTPLDGGLWGDVVEVRRAPGRSAGDGDHLECRGRFAHRLPAEPRANLVFKARDAFAGRLDEPLPALDFVLYKNLPVASGLGGSASSVAATLVALNELFGRPLDARALLAAAGEAEAQASGAVHLDNVGPALLGGLRLVDPESGSRALPFPEDLLFVLWVPELELETRLARSVLPRELSLPHAIAWAQNLGALIHALHVDDRALLRAVLRDTLAEPHRAALVPGFREVQRAALAAGALGCTLSGAGPAVFAVVERAAAEAIAAAGLAAWRAAGVAVAARLCRLDLQGARRVASQPAAAD